MEAHRLNGFHFSLDFSPQRAQMLMKQKHAATHFADRFLKKELLSALGYIPPFMFTIEYSRDGKLHLHGVIIPAPENDNVAMRKKITTAMHKAGGKVKYATQVKIGVITEPLGWAAYMFKDTTRIRKVMKHCVSAPYYFNNEMTKHISDYHQNTRPH
ncbi:hypothetical protein G3A39_42770, partial [Paraburkholderia aspalathi]|nr:hypothetical protein [Paraburkholderia aspalathi]